MLGIGSEEGEKGEEEEEEEDEEEGKGDVGMGTLTRRICSVVPAVGGVLCITIRCALLFFVCLFVCFLLRRRGGVYLKGNGGRGRGREAVL